VIAAPISQKFVTPVKTGVQGISGIDEIPLHRSQLGVNIIELLPRYNWGGIRA